MDIVATIKSALTGAALDEHRRGLIDLAMGNIALLNQRIALLEADNTRLKADLIASKAGGLPACPYCGVRAWRRIGTRQGPDYAFTGLLFVTQQCDSCGKKQECIPNE